MPDTISPASTMPADLKPTGSLGKPVDRVDGRLKVTGKAPYAAEGPVEGVVHGVLVSASIAKGKITDIDTAAAEKSPGVLAVLTHKNRPKMNDSAAKMLGESRLPLADDQIHYNGQYVAIVIADTIERARSAAMLVKTTYAAEKPLIDINDPASKAEFPGKNQGKPLQFTKGDPTKAIADPKLIKVKETYVTPYETHNPMELHSTIAQWGENGDKLTVWDSTQAVIGRRRTIANAFGLKEENVRVLCPYVGGAFGCKGDAWTHVPLTVAAAKTVGKPVKVMLTRGQMFTGVGHRPITVQDIHIGATPDGIIQTIGHNTIFTDNELGHHTESAGIGSSAAMYRTPNLQFTHKIVRNNIGPGTYMRAPGENPGTFALETAIDELAYALKMDPLKVRRLNHATASPVSNKPYSTMNLDKAFDVGAEKFGWNKRPAQVGTLKTPDGKLIGYGVATASYPAHRFPNQARIRLMPDGSGGIKAVGQCATQDLGTGSWTIFTQLTASLTGLPIEKCKFELGDSLLPPGGVSGGSATAAGVGQALSEAASKLKENLIKYADGTPLQGLAVGDVELRGDQLVAKNDPSKSVPIAPLITKTGRAYIEGQSDPSRSGADHLDEKEKKYTFHSFGVHFVEVQIDQPVPKVHVTRVVSVMDIGLVLNAKTARSQVLGGVVMGIGQALMEETIYDPRNGMPVNNSLAEYLVPVNPDINEIDVSFVGEPDYAFNAIGCRGVGEIGITGIAAAVGNAIYHATGKRLREAPFKIENLL